MPQQPRDRRASGGGRPRRVPHHINAIAHLFFADDDDGAGPRRLAVVGLDPGRASAYACAGLVAWSRRRGAVDLVEDPRLTWTADAYLRAAAPDAEAGYPRIVGTHPDGEVEVRWDHLGDGAAGTLDALEAWCGAVAAAPANWPAREIRPGRDGLVVCGSPRSLGSWQGAARLGRLMGLLRPARLEILLFPASWGGGGGAGRLTGHRDLAELVQALATESGAPAEIGFSSGLPEAGAGGRDGAELFGRVADRLLDEKGVDPGS